MLDREEYIEQAYFFRALADRAQQNLATQDLLQTIREELLSTTKLPMAIDFLASELRHGGVFAPAMARLSHYFTPFQTFVVEMAENDRAKFDFAVALEILHREAVYRAEGVKPEGMFLFQFECLCRNRLGYDRGLTAMAADPSFDSAWREWILTIRRQIGIIDLADLIYVRSELYLQTRVRQGETSTNPAQGELPALFGVKEGKIALANRLRDPLLLFASLQRHLNYPLAPRPKPVDEARQILPALVRRVERLEARLKLLEQEQKGGIDLTKFYRQQPVGDDEEG
jgi:hypothetical protein